MNVLRTLQQSYVVMSFSGNLDGREHFLLWQYHRMAAENNLRNNCCAVETVLFCIFFYGSFGLSLKLEGHFGSRRKSLGLDGRELRAHGHTVFPQKPALFIHSVQIFMHAQYPVPMLHSMEEEKGKSTAKHVLGESSTQTINKFVIILRQAVQVSWRWSREHNDYLPYLKFCLQNLFNQMIRTLGQLNSTQRNAKEPNGTETEREKERIFANDGSWNNNNGQR